MITEPTTPSRRPNVIGWVLPGALSLGFLTWAGFLYAGIKSGRRDLKLYTWGYLAVLVIGISLSNTGRVGSDGSHTGVGSNLGIALVVFGAWIGGVVHALLAYGKMNASATTQAVQFNNAAPRSVVGEVTEQIRMVTRKPAADPVAQPAANPLANLPETITMITTAIDGPNAISPVAAQHLSEIRKALSDLARYRNARPDAAHAVAEVNDVVGGYVREALNTYLALPGSFVTTYRGSGGETPAEDFDTQMELIRESVTNSAEAVYAGDAQRLAAQNAFLRSKMSKSELDL